MPTLNTKSPRRPWQPERKAHARRTKENREIYNTPRWRADSRAHRSAYPICQICEANDLIVPSEVSDHIKPINEGGSVWDWSNRQAICKKCHNSKSGREAHKSNEAW